MKIIIKDTAEEASTVVAEMLLQQISHKPESVLGLPTGLTPLAVYSRLKEQFRKNRGSYGGISTFNLDEYCGFSGDDPSSYAFYMRENLFRYIDILPSNTHIPNGAAESAIAEAERYEALISSHGGIDLMFLGIGRNAHIGFNEPGSPRDSRTRRVELTPSTIEANSQHFSSSSLQPTHAITMGIGTILDSRKIVVLATGAQKASAVKASLMGPLSEAVPGSVLTKHRDVTFVLDHEAASHLDKATNLELNA